MTKNNNELDFELLEDLIMKLEIKEAVENGDLGEINFCLKHLLRFISTSSQVQKGLIDKQNDAIKDIEPILKNNNKLIELNSRFFETITKLTEKYDEEILKLVERVNALEEAKK